MNWLTTALREAATLAGRALTAYERFTSTGMQKRSGLANPDQWLTDFCNGGKVGTTGVAVNESTALTMSAVWRAVTILSQTEATLPVKVVENTSDDEEIIRKDMPAYRLLKLRANPTLNALQFRMLMTQWVVLRGNAYAEIEFDLTGKPVNLWPMSPKYVKIWIAPDGTIWYEYRPPAMESVTLPAKQVLHIRGMGGDGITGWSVIHNARESLGNALAADRFAGHYFGGGVNVGAVLEHPQTLSEEAHNRLIKSSESMMSGLENAHRLAILEEGMTLSRNDMPLDDAQMLETRHFGIEDVSRWFGVPQHMLSEMGRATWSNIESLAIEFVQYGLVPWLAIWEAECNAKLFGIDNDDRYQFKHIVEGLLRGDSAARSAFYQSGIQNGWLLRNEVRNKEDLPPIPGGDIPLVPANMQNAEKLDEEPPEPPPVPPPVPPAPEEGDEEDRTIPLRIAEAHKGTFGSTARWLLHKEAIAARRNAKRSPKGFAKWVNNWYETHELEVRAAFGPSCDALVQTLAIASGKPEDPSEALDLAKRVSEHHTRRSKQELLQVASAAGLENLAGQINDLVSGWEASRADELAIMATGDTDA